MNYNWILNLLPAQAQPVLKFLLRVLTKGGTPELRHAWAVAELVKKGMKPEHAEADITHNDRLIRFLQSGKDESLPGEAL